MKLTVGSDIEYFVTNAQSSHPEHIIPGSEICHFDKNHPAVYPHGKMHWDNILIEICPNEADNEKDFVSNINSMKDLLHTETRKKNAQVVKYTSAYISTTLNMSPMAQNFGCSPDLNAYSRRVQKIAYNPQDKLRTAGGHVHIGLDRQLNIDEKILLAQLCDLYLGIPSILLEEDNLRRKLYGKAGSFRPKSYGIEYRVLSSFWANEDRLIKWVYNQVEDIVEFFNAIIDENLVGTNFFKTGDVSKSVQKIINTTDRRSAKEYIKTSNIAMP